MGKMKKKRKSARAIGRQRYESLKNYMRLKREGHPESEEDFKQDDFGDPWLSCQADVNKLVELKRTKSSEDQTIDVKIEPIDESDKPDDITQPIDESGSHNSDADQPTDEEDNKERVVIEINQINNESNQQFDDSCQEESNPEKNVFSETFNHQVVWRPPHDATVEAQCSGCLVLGAGEQATTMLEECFGIQAAGALLCGACADRLRAALRFKRAVVACHAQLTRHPPPCAGAPAAAVIKEEKDLLHKNNACDLSTVDEAPDSEIPESQSNIEESDIPYPPSIKPFAQVKPDKIVEKPKKKVTTAPKIYDPDEPAKKKVAYTHFTRFGDSYSCNYCDAFVDFDNILTHRYNIHGLVQCPLCVMRFRTKKILIKHKIDEHGVDDNRCNVCDKSFYNLSAHMDSVHKLGQKMKCTECDFESYSQTGLKRHKVVHTRERNFKCQHCDKTFLYRNNWRSHERIHTGDKRKVCTECGQAFVQKASLTYHMAKYHPNARN